MIVNKLLGLREIEDCAQQHEGAIPSRLTVENTRVSIRNQFSEKARPGSFVMKWVPADFGIRFRKTDLAEEHSQRRIKGTSAGLDLWIESVKQP